MILIITITMILIITIAIITMVRLTTPGSGRAETMHCVPAQHWWPSGEVDEILGRATSLCGRPFSRLRICFNRCARFLHGRPAVGRDPARFSAAASPTLVAALQTTSALCPAYRHWPSSSFAHTSKKKFLCGILEALATAGSRLDAFSSKFDVPNGQARLQQGTTGRCTCYCENSPSIPLDICGCKLSAKASSQALWRDRHRIRASKSVELPWKVVKFLQV